MPSLPNPEEGDRKPQASPIPSNEKGSMGGEPFRGQLGKPEAPIRIEIAIRPNQRDVVGEQTQKRIGEALQLQVKDCRFVEVYTLDGELTAAEQEKLCSETLVDRIIQEAHWKEPAYPGRSRIEVGFLPGITDNIGQSASQAVRDALGKEMPVYYSRMYCFDGPMEEGEAQRIATLLHNPMVERFRLYPPGHAPQADPPRVVIQDRIHVARFLLRPGRKETQQLIEKQMLALRKAEVAAIAAYLEDKKVLKERKTVELDERITDVELETIAQTWSEHCKHKIFNARIEYSENGEKHVINGLFPVFIRQATENVHKPYVVSVFRDNGGIIKFDPHHDIAIKVETHNAPSALDPYGGTLTGILGVQRDVLGTGLGASPVADMDVLCCGYLHETAVPGGCLRPAQIFQGFVKGIEHGGNKMGIPTVNGSIVFEKDFTARPLVYCGTVGIMPTTLNDNRRTVEKLIRPGYLAVMVGGRIGKDGIHGATFSSRHIDEHVPQSVVQIGDPITQKKMMDFVLEARDRRLYEAITDNGAGGLSSSIGELAQLSGGCRIDLDQCPLKYPGLQPWEILVSESQERMTLAVPEERWAELENLARKHEVEVSRVGQFTRSGYFHCTYRGKTVAYLDMKFLHEGLPRLELKAGWQRKTFKEPVIGETDLALILRRLLASPNISSRECVVRQYDHEVKAGSVIKPVGGGVNDAAVIRPLLESNEGIVLGHGICPKIIQDSHSMAMLAFDEAVRNVLAVGAKFAYLAALDNFCWPDPVASERNPDGEYKLAQLVRACIGVYDVATGYGVPLVSGKDSMKNDYHFRDEKYSIPPTLLISVVGKIDDVHRAVTSPFKQPGDYIYVLGRTKEELGGSEYFRLFNGTGNREPTLAIEENAALYKAISQASEQGLWASLHDVSDGGLGVALSECAMMAGLGMDIHLESLIRETERDDALLFSESAGRFVASVNEANIARFEKLLEGVPFARIGRVRGDKRFIVRGLNREIIINEDVRDLKSEWERGICPTS